MKISVLDTPTISTTITEIPTNITQKNIVQNKNSKNHPSTLVYFRIYIPDYIVSHNNIIKIPGVIRGVVFLYLCRCCPFDLNMNIKYTYDAETSHTII